MRRIVHTTIFSSFLLLLAATGIAQTDSTGPHGGRLKNAGIYKIELLGCDNYVELYLFDSDTEAINNTNISGEVAFYYSSQSSLYSHLTHYGMDGFTAKIPVNTFSFCKVSLNVNGAFILSEKFENECLVKLGKN